MRVTVLPDRDTHDLRVETVAEVLTALKFHQDAYLVVRGDQILTRDTRLKETDELEIWPVISGGAR